MVIGTDLVLIWVSIIPVESLGLGLLLGRDWLDGVGCVLSFSKKIMRADHLSGKHISLHQLTAGRFALRLIPSEWPRPGSQRWRRVGQDGVVALQIAHHEWLQRKLLAVQFVGNPHHDLKSHEHLLSEHSVCAAKLVGMSVEAGSNSLNLARRIAYFESLAKFDNILFKHTRSRPHSRDCSWTTRSTSKVNRWESGAGFSSACKQESYGTCTAFAYGCVGGRGCAMCPFRILQLAA